MANQSYVASLFSSVTDPIKSAVLSAFTYVLQNLRFGHCTSGTRCENMQIYAFDATTPSTANQQFSVAHNLNKIPYLVIGGVARLDTVGRQTVPLKVTKLPDAHYLYLSSPTTSAPITVLVEA